MSDQEKRPTGHEWKPLTKEEKRCNSVNWIANAFLKSVGRAPYADRVTKRSGTLKLERSNDGTERKKLAAWEKQRVCDELSAEDLDSYGSKLYPDELEAAERAKARGGAWITRAIIDAKRLRREKLMHWAADAVALAAAKEAERKSMEY